MAAKKKKKRRRSVKPVVETIKVLEAALKEIQSAATDLNSASMRLDFAQEAAADAVGETGGVIEVLQERIDELKHTKHAKGG